MAAVFHTTISTEGQLRESAGRDSKSEVALGAIIEDIYARLDKVEAENKSLRAGKTDIGKFSLLNVGPDPNTFGTLLGICEGDCDSDRDCAFDLKCFQRNTGEQGPPECVGTPFIDYDYCSKVSSTVLEVTSSV